MTIYSEFSHKKMGGSVHSYVSLPEGNSHGRMAITVTSSILSMKVWSNLRWLGSTSFPGKKADPREDEIDRMGPQFVC